MSTEPTETPPPAGSSLQLNRPLGGAEAERLRPSVSKDSGCSWREELKGALILFVALQVLIGLAFVGVKVHGDKWREWIRQLANQARAMGLGEGGLGSVASREPTVVYYGPGKLSLGMFQVEVYDPVTHTILRADFRVDARAECENRQDFHAFVAMHHHLVREQVMVAVRNATLEELTDPEHKLLKRRILRQVNLALGRAFLHSVEVKNFSLWESVDRTSFLPYESSEDGSGPGSQPLKAGSW